jgi:hypothetical protein
MDRRAFLGTLALLAAPLAVEAQPAGKVYRLGFLGNQNPTQGASTLEGYGADRGWAEFGNPELEKSGPDASEPHS